ncbi:4'-phosphopantetheinyl transferase family protein [Aureibacter tunicatorum]|uniref:Phosphopantetheinyl transferase n=2 Tax=Aureibacter tunicatorum TaxID=866807 RepID=A0AAE4BUG0_9BACT|nr:4'-phosphopantetheinyl transferase superfamily protein [Aureibacter tunicatorum]MDR6240733.1 phosphopantetheinyl transferase [Aureibacter tunicatorum]
MNNIYIEEFRWNDRNYKIALGISDENNNFESLHDIEKKELNENTYDKERSNAYINSRILAKEAAHKIGLTTNIDDFHIEKGILGQPLLKGINHDYQISISHSKNIATILLYPSELLMGIDIEQQRDDLPKLIKNELSTQEKYSIEKHAFPSRKALEIWTAKEALAKTIKTGLSISSVTLETKNKGYRQYTYPHATTFKAITHHLQQNYCLCICMPNINHLNIFNNNISQ